MFTSLFAKPGYQSKMFDTCTKYTQLHFRTELYIDANVIIVIMILTKFFNKNVNKKHNNEEETQEETVRKR